MANIDSRLIAGARSQKEGLLAASEGILESGFYGATWKDQKDADIVVFLGHAAAGLITLNVREHETAHWLRDHYCPPEAAVDPSGFLMLSTAGRWYITSLSVYSQVIRDAAAENMLVFATDDIKAAMEAMYGPAQEQPSEESASGELPEEISNMISAVSEAIAEHHREHHEDALNGGTAAERFGDPETLFSGEEAVALFARADDIQREVDASLYDHFDADDGFDGDLPDSTAAFAGLTKEAAHVHAEVALENGLVYLHAAEADDYKGIPFLGEILAIPFDDEEYAIGNLVLERYRDSFAHLNRVAVAISNWSQVVALAKLCKIVIFRGECSAQCGDPRKLAEVEETQSATAE